MKKVILIIVIGMVLPLFMVGQEAAKINLSTPLSGSRDGEYVCPDDAIFSQPPVNFYSAVINSYGWPQIIYDKFTGVTEPIWRIRFWEYISGPGFPVEFTIEFYTDNGNNLGTLVNSWVMNLSPSFTTVDGYGVYDITLPAGVNLSSGWLGINVSDSRYHYMDIAAWLMTDIGDDDLIFSLDFNEYRHDTNNCSFCLMGKAKVIPLSNLTIILVSALILITTAIGIRRMS